MKYASVLDMPHYVEQLSEEEWMKVKGYASLAKHEQDLLKRVYIRHMNGMGRDMRFKYYGAHRIKEVKRDVENNSINVFYKTKDWWHYDTRGDWW